MSWQPVVPEHSIKLFEFQGQGTSCNFDCLKKDFNDLKYLDRAKNTVELFNQLLSDLKENFKTRLDEGYEFPGCLESQLELAVLSEMLGYVRSKLNDSSPSNETESLFSHARSVYECIQSSISGAVADSDEKTIEAIAIELSNFQSEMGGFNHGIDIDNLISQIASYHSRTHLSVPESWKLLMDESSVPNDQSILHINLIPYNLEEVLSKDFHRIGIISFPEKTELHNLTEFDLISLSKNPTGDKYHVGSEESFVDVFDVKKLSPDVVKKISSIKFLKSNMSGISVLNFLAQFLDVKDTIRLTFQVDGASIQAFSQFKHVTLIFVINRSLVDALKKSKTSISEYFKISSLPKSVQVGLKVETEFDELATFMQSLIAEGIKIVQFTSKAPAVSQNMEILSVLATIKEDLEFVRLTFSNVSMITIMRHQQNLANNPQQAVSEAISHEHIAILQEFKDLRIQDLPEHEIKKLSNFPNLTEIALIQTGIIDSLPELLFKEGFTTHHLNKMTVQLSQKPLRPELVKYFEFSVDEVNLLLGNAELKLIDVLCGSDNLIVVGILDQGRNRFHVDACLDEELNENLLKLTGGFKLIGFKLIRV
jgi:hypothetical protein